jgi:hypothetical protein
MVIGAVERKNTDPELQFLLPLCCGYFGTYRRKLLLITVDRIFAIIITKAVFVLGLVFFVHLFHISEQ